jgi:signal transduction histidine kinase
VTRRILIILLAFTAAILVGAVVPLTLDAASHDRTSFLENTEGLVRTDAAVAQTRLDGQSDVTLISLFNQIAQSGDGLLILANKGNTPQGPRLEPLVSKGMPSGNWDHLAAEAEQVGQPPRPVPETTATRRVAAMAVYLHGERGPLVGVVILARSTASLNRSILTLWIILGTISVAAMLCAALLAFALARWVSRPLARLDIAAGRLAEGDLTSRAVVGSGPPELRRTATTFNTMAGRLESLVHGNRAVIADVSHQLRTPLAALRLRLDLLAVDTAQSDPEAAHELAGALDELARLSRLVDGLLAVARAENVMPVPAAVDVTEVAAERAVAWHPVADERGITLAAPAADASASVPVQAWIGEGHLEQVLDNLIANALDALNTGDRIVVSVTATTGGARIVVRDNGPGMNAEERERAFLRFSTSNPNGTGLGLAIVHRLVTSNGGTAALSETPGGGLTVTLDFPGVPVPNGGVSVSNGASAQDFLSL